MQRLRFFFSPLRTLVCSATLLGMGLPAWSASWFPLGVYGDAASYFDTDDELNPDRTGCQHRDGDAAAVPTNRYGFSCEHSWR